MIFATLADRKTMRNAVVLARSVKQFYPEAKTVLCLAGTERSYEQPAFFDETVFVSVKRDGEEAGLSPYKAYFIRNLLESHEEPVIFMNPQSRLYAPIPELLHELTTRDIVAVPYYLEPRDEAEEEIERLQHGILYAGFLAVKPSRDGKKFAAWWLERITGSRLASSQTADSEHRWLSLAANPFHISLFKHPAYQLSAWNLDERSRTLHIVQGQYYIGSSLLKSACFDNENGRLERQLAKVENAALQQLVSQYAEQCSVNSVTPERRY